MSKHPPKGETVPALGADYGGLIGGIGALLDEARRAAARSVNALMTATYWEIGRRIVEFEQGGKARAGYAEELLLRLSEDLTTRFGRGFSRQNLQNMRHVYLIFPICQTASGELAVCPICQTVSSEATDSPRRDIATRTVDFAEIQRHSIASRAGLFPLSWSHYVLLATRSRSPAALKFYHAEALRGGWSVRQLQRQIDAQFYERTALSRHKAAMLKKGQEAKPEDALTADDEVKDPFVIEFLGLKDEYSESDLEEALIHHLEAFLLELGNDFAFVGRQRRLRIDDQWYRVDLLFFHRRLRCLVVIDLKLGRFTHADAGQMHLYLNYAREHWTQEDENPPVGLILCASKGAALVRYATEGLPNQVLVREYLTALPDEQILAAEIDRTRKRLEGRGM